MSEIRTAKLCQVLDLLEKLESVKPLYAELDALIVEMHSEGFQSEVIDGMLIQLVDNFAEKNTVFRPAGVKRFEFKVKEAK